MAPADTWHRLNKIPVWRRAGRAGDPRGPHGAFHGAFPASTAQGRTQDFRRGGGREEGGGPRSAKEAKKPNKRATGLKPATCAHQGSMFRP